MLPYLLQLCLLLYQCSSINSDYLSGRWQIVITAKPSFVRRLRNSAVFWKVWCNSCPITSQAKHALLSDAPNMFLFSHSWTSARVIATLVILWPSTPALYGNCLLPPKKWQKDECILKMPYRNSLWTKCEGFFVTGRVFGGESYEFSLA